MKRRDRYVISWATAEAFQFGNFLNGLFHAWRQLRIEDDVTLALVFEDGGSDGFAKFVAGASRIFTRIFRVNLELGEISKITKPKSQNVRMRESVFCGLKEKNVKETRKPPKSDFQTKLF
jgi:hypothetical protein